MADADVVATAIIFPACIDGSHGIVAACCTEDSMLVVRLHSRIDGGIIGRTPAWLLYECYFFVGMSLLNWSGMTDPTYAANSRRMGLFATSSTPSAGTLVYHRMLQVIRRRITPFPFAILISRVSVSCSLASALKYGWNSPAVAARLSPAP